MLQSARSQRVGHGLATEQQQQNNDNILLSSASLPGLSLKTPYPPERGHRLPSLTGL